MSSSGFESCLVLPCNNLVGQGGKKENQWFCPQKPDINGVGGGGGELQEQLEDEGMSAATAKGTDRP